MKNITYRIEGGNVSVETAEKIHESFKRRVSEIVTADCCAIIVINPVLSNYRNLNCELISGNTPRYLAGDYSVTPEIRIRLATFYPEQKDICLLFIINYNKCKNELSPFTTANVYIPLYLKQEAKLLQTIILLQDINENKTNNIFCISGEIGTGKTYFVSYLAGLLNRVVNILRYSDIDGENTSIISSNIDAFFRKIEKNSIVLVEDADSFLVGNNINRFVKNALLSVLLSHRSYYIIIETINPGLFENDIKKYIFRYTYIKPLNDALRFEYLQHFIKLSSLTLLSISKDSLSLVGFSVKDIEHLVFMAEVYKYTGLSEYESIARACEEVKKSKLHSVLASDVPFIAMHPKHKLDDLILPPSKKDIIRYAISLIDNIPLVFKKWGFESIDPYPRAILNFYGKPGTGKTMCAHAIASHLGKDILALNYAEIESKYIGDAPKKLESAFAYASQHDVVMFFDEADSFLGKRIENVSHSADQALNSLRSTMLIQLEIYKGVVIFATNLRENYDKAFQSRFLYEIEFDLPDNECRDAIINSYVQTLKPLINASYSDDELKMLTKETEGFSGRDIKSVVLEALNQLAYNTNNNKFELVKDINEINLPLSILTDCIIRRKINKNLNIKINTDVKEEKKLIGEQLKENLATERRKDIYRLLISIGYYAAWADGVLQNAEIEVIRTAQLDLNIQLPDYSVKDNLPDWNDLINEISTKNLSAQAIDFSYKIIISDGYITPLEVEFISKLCKDLHIKQSVLDEILMFVDKSAENVMHWQTLLSDIEIV